MKYLPFENIVYRTKFSFKEVEKKLVDNTELFRSFGNQEDEETAKSKPYKGYFERGAKFVIRRKIVYSNSFLPRISGKVSENDQGVQVSIKMKLDITSLIVTSIWLSIVLAVFVGVTVKMISNNEFTPAIFIVIAMFLMGYGFAIIPFKMESKRTKTFFEKLFETKAEDM